MADTQGIEQSLAEIKVEYERFASGSPVADGYWTNLFILAEKKIPWLVSTLRDSLSEVERLKAVIVKGPVESMCPACHAVNPDGGGPIR